MGRLSANWLKKHRFAPGDVFIQTGTYNGVSLQHCAPHFKTIHTIELDDHYFNSSKLRLAKYGNIACHHGSSPVVLRRVIDSRRQTLFWLDAHYVATDTLQPKPKQVANQCPLLWELSAIFNARWRAPITILIDDAIFFQAWFWRKIGKSRLYDRSQWPRDTRLRAMAAEFGYAMRQIDDVFVIAKE